MVAETTFARLGRDQSPRAIGGANPACGREGVEQRTSDAPGDVVALFCPIDAAVHSAVRGQCHPQRAEGATAGLGELVDDAVAEPAGERGPPALPPQPHAKQ